MEKDEEKEESKELPGDDCEVVNKLPRVRSGTFRVKGSRKHVALAKAKIINAIIANPLLSIREAGVLHGVSDSTIRYLQFTDRHFREVLSKRLLEAQDALVTRTRKVLESSDGRTTVLAARALWDFAKDFQQLDSDKNGSSNNSVTVNVAVIGERLGSTSIGQAILSPIATQPGLVNNSANPPPLLEHAQVMPDNVSYQASRSKPSLHQPPADWSDHVTDEEEPE